MQWIILSYVNKLRDWNIDNYFYFSGLSWGAGATDQWALAAEELDPGAVGAQWSVRADEHRAGDVRAILLRERALELLHTGWRPRTSHTLPKAGDHKRQGPVQVGISFGGIQFRWGPVQVGPSSRRDQFKWVSVRDMTSSCGHQFRWVSVLVGINSGWDHIRWEPVQLGTSSNGTRTNQQ